MFDGVCVCAVFIVLLFGLYVQAVCAIYSDRFEIDSNDKTNTNFANIQHLFF